MKRLFLTLGVLCAAGLAQAVSVAWQGSGAGTYAINYEVGTAFAITGTFTTPPASEEMKWADFVGVAANGFGDEDVNLVKLSKGMNKVNGHNYGQFRLQGGGDAREAQYSGQNMNDATTYHFSLVIDTTKAGEHSVTLYVDGQPSGSAPVLTFDNGITAAFTQFRIYDRGATGDTYYVWSAEAGEDLHAIAQAASASGTVPEPTALALLALGVAGLALRRR